MEKEKMQLTDDLSITTYPFSDYITCVEVTYNGEIFSSFCSDNTIVEEWIENPDQLIAICQKQIKHQAKKQPSTGPLRQVLTQGLEVEYYPFSDDVFCVNVFRNGTFNTSFCTDKASFDEWQEDPEAMLSVVKSMVL